MIIAASAPLTVLAGGVPTNFAVSGLLGVPLSYLFLGLILLLFAVGYVSMSRHISNAGAFYAYVTEGLGNRQGIAAAILALVSYNMMQIGLYGMFGFSSSAALTVMSGIHIPWWGTGLVGWFLVGILGVKSIDLSAKVLGVLVALEFIVVLVVSILSLVEAPEGITAQTLQPNQFFTGGLGVLLAFGIAAFMGFESGAIYSEEAKERGKTVARATYIAISIIAVFYAFSSWAFAVGVGSSQIIAKSVELGPDLVFVWLSERSVFLANLANILFVTSLFAALLAFHNAAARYFFSLGRSRVLPAQFAKSSNDGVPIAGSVAQSGLAFAIIILFIATGISSELGDLYPVLTLFTWFTNAAAFGLVFLLAVTSISVMIWFLRNHYPGNIFVRLIAPALSAVSLVIVALLILFNFDLMIGEQNSPLLVYIMPGIIIASGVVGLVWGEVLHRRRPEIFESIRHLDQSTSAIPQQLRGKSTTTNNFN